MKLKEYYSYKNYFLKECRKKVKVKSDGILYVKVTTNNIFLSLISNEGKVDSLKSLGSYDFKKIYGRKSSLGYQAIFKKLIKEIRNKKWENINIFYTGLQPTNFYLINYLSQRKIGVLLLRDLTRIPYNGCRIRKAPRR